MAFERSLTGMDVQVSDEVLLQFESLRALITGERSTHRRAIAPAGFAEQIQLLLNHCPLGSFEALVATTA